MDKYITFFSTQMDNMKYIALYPKKKHEIYCYLQKKNEIYCSIKYKEICIGRL